MRATIKTTMRQLGMKNTVLFVFGFVATSMAIAGCAELTGPESPETPTNVTATLLTGTSVRVQWEASPQSDGVISYNILRNGTKVGESTSTSFTDTGLAEQATFEYSVSANCTSGVLSDASPVTAASTVRTLDVTSPRVVSNQPPSGSSIVSTFATVTATFSEAMDPATINTTTFVLKVMGTGALIPATVTYTAATRVAELKPTSQLPSTTIFTATVTTGAKDVNGIAVATPFNWTFTTVDQTGPTVIATNPTNGAGGVSPTAPNISVTFSEAMDQSTINTTSFTLRLTSSGASVAGTVAYNNVSPPTATFTPNAPLAPGVSYTATVAASVRDVAGNALGTAFQFTFTTADTAPPTLILTAPANLATGVATNSLITAAFNEAMDPATINSTTFTLRVAATSAAVTGTVTYNVATATATFTPSAPLAPSTSYIATVTTGAKDLAGNALAASVIPNPWTFTTASAPTVSSTNPANLATSVPTSVVLSATFSQAMDPTTINATTFTLRVTATSAPVTGTVGYNVATNTATFTPSAQLIATTAYTATITTGSKNASGTALAVPFSWTFSTATAPTVSSTNPANLATNVATTVVLSATFSEAMDPTTITTTTFTLRVTATSVPVTGAVAYNAATNTATFTPSAPLTATTAYTATITTGAKNLSGTALVAPFSWTFSTTDNVPPTVTTVSPATGATSVSTGTTVNITFSEAMDATTISITTITLKITATSAPVTGTVSYNSTTNVATFTPTVALTAGTGYTVTVTTGVKDLAGNAMAAPFTSTFTTAP